MTLYAKRNTMPDTFSSITTTSEMSRGEVEALSELALAVQEAVALAILERIPRAERAEYVRLEDVGDVAALEQFLEKHIPSPKVFIAKARKEALVRFQELLETETR